MPEYKVKVSTGDLALSHTLNDVYIKLVGEDDESQLVFLKGAGNYFGSDWTYMLECPSLGKLLMVELEKKSRPLFITDDWFVDNVEVTSPEKTVYKFPIFEWIQDEDSHFYREGKAVLIFNEDNDETRVAREKELKHRRKEYCWSVYKEGMPRCMKADSGLDLPLEVRFSYTKATEFLWTAAEGLLRMKIAHLQNCKDPWTDFDDIHKVFNWHKNDSSKYVYNHWRDDAFFGYQFLNGLNPMLIRRCSSLPENFPVTEETVKLEGGAELSQEMKKGNIFLCDYKLLDGVKTNVINDEEQYLTAPLVLLHKTFADKLMPVAIQLKQQPADDNPIFVPSDAEYDWLTAKTFVRSADFNLHELNVHLLRTHLLAEVFAVALLRNLPRVHPLYKLLVPSTRYTLQINTLARGQLISDEGVLTLYSSSGGEGMVDILERSTSALTYSSLCLPDNIQERGMENVPNYFYRDDGLQLWDIIHKFVKDVLTFYYQSDADVKKDSELQDYIKDIFEQGFLSNTESGIPQSFRTVPELVKFVTMVIFTCSAQHSAVNNGQMDFGNWMPNFPPSLQRPPPSKKGRTDESTLLNTLPDVNATVNILSVLWLLTTPSTDFVDLGQFPRERFTEDKPREFIQNFEKDLEKLDKAIEKRNKKLDLPYTYLQPRNMENSITI